MRQTEYQLDTLYNLDPNPVDDSVVMGSIAHEEH